MYLKLGLRSSFNPLLQGRFRANLHGMCFDLKGNSHMKANTSSPSKKCINESRTNKPLEIHRRVRVSSLRIQPKSQPGTGRRMSRNRRRGILAKLSQRKKIEKKEQ